MKVVLGVAFSFLVGFSAAKLLDRAHPETAACADHLKTTSAMVMSQGSLPPKIQGSAAPSKEGPTHIVPLPSNAAAPQVRRTAEAPREEAKILSEEEEAKLSDLLQKPLGTAGAAGIFQRSNADGSVDVSGTTPEGRKYYEHFNPRSELTRDGWTDSAGEKVFRAYYDSGEMKLVTWTRTDHGMTSINMSQSGLFESRYDKFADGSSAMTQYDDAGQVLHVWRVDRNGKRTEIR